MSQRGLEALLRPESIAVVGASNKPGRAGYLMMRNLLDSGFNGPVLPVTPAYRAVCGVLTWRDVISLPMSPDLAILCTHADRNLALLEQLGLTYIAVQRHVFDRHLDECSEGLTQSACVGARWRG